MGYRVKLRVCGVEGRGWWLRVTDKLRGRGSGVRSRG
jgi:hypothetical protein